MGYDDVAFILSILLILSILFLSQYCLARFNLESMTDASDC
jgi:hypothetical protein